MGLILSKGRYHNIVTEPPGPRALEVLRRDEQYLMQSFARWYPLVVESAEGFLVRDVDGNVYIDFNSGLAVMNVGHRHPAVLSAIKEQLGKFLHYSITDFAYEISVTLAEKLVAITPGAWEKKVFFCNSGAEAVEGSIKTARAHFRGSRPIIIAFTGSFHGRTFGALSLTSSKAVQRRGFQPLLPCIEHVPYPYCYRCPYRLSPDSCGMWCIDFIEEWLFEKYVPPEEVAAIVFEPIAGEGGYIVPPDGFFQKLKRLADKYGILLVDDEVQAGMGRTGKWFAIEHWGVAPDIVAIAKGVASGLPLGVIVGRADVMDIPKGGHASTFGGNPVSCAAALAVIRVIEEERLLERASRLGDYILSRLKEWMEEYHFIGDVRGKGLMIGMELVSNEKTKEPAQELAAKTILNAFKRGLLVVGAGKSVIRIAPPLVITRDAIDEGLEILEQSLRDAAKSLGLL